ncbi:MAG: CPBP family glutamic-type intramembrane protease [Paracoccaceae bacterium]
MSLAPAASPPVSRVRLKAEFALLFLGLPALLAFGLGPGALWSVMIGAFLASVALLAVTPGVSWRELVEGPLVGAWGGLLLFTTTTAALATGAVLWLAPEALFGLPRRATGLWLAIMLLYPLLSALPQEVMFRMLFYRRYGVLFPDRRAAVAVNAAVFALAHGFLWNPTALAMTAAGGVLFSLAYLETGKGRNLLFATLLHAIAGWVIFTVGLGRFFYHGAAPV